MGMEIKFRAWDADNGRFYYFFIGQGSGCFQETYDRLCLNGANFEQFTGLLDKNGANEELYCGDLMSCGCGNYPIEWDDIFTGYIVNVENDQYPLHQYIYQFGAKKTGNIHENPELLEPTN
jgi:hypothetical protein